MPPCPVLCGRMEQNTSLSHARNLNGIRGRMRLHKGDLPGCGTVCRPVGRRCPGRPWRSRRPVHPVDFTMIGLISNCMDYAKHMKSKTTPKKLESTETDARSFLSWGIRLKTFFPVSENVNIRSSVFMSITCYSIFSFLDILHIAFLAWVASCRQVDIKLYFSACKENVIAIFPALFHISIDISKDSNRCRFHPKKAVASRHEVQQCVKQ